MSLTDALAIAATSWGLVMALSPLLQIRVIVKRRDPRGTSPTWCLILLVGYTLWGAYGFASGEVPLMIANTVSFVVGTALLATILVLRRRKPEMAVPEER
jgi:MtN3 and saliva related transmembrane protein